MKTSTFLWITGAVVAAVYLLGRPGKSVRMGAPGRADADNAPVVHLVEDTLHRHEGEENPVVLAFEEALAHEQAKA